MRFNHPPSIITACVFPSTGFGSFVEKTVMPYISTTPAKLRNPCTNEQNCTSPFSYKNVLSLTDKGEVFNELVGSSAYLEIWIHQKVALMRSCKLQFVGRSLVGGM